MLIKKLSRDIYKPYLERVWDLYKQAVQFNEGEPFNYLFFNEEGRMYTHTPGPRAKEFLDQYVPELAPVMNEKAIIEAYLLRFQNKLPSHAAILHLVPESIMLKHCGTEYWEIPPQFLSLVQEFQSMPEYTLIKKRIFLGTIYAS